MQNFLYTIIAVGLLVILTAKPASTCAVNVGLKLEDIQYASVVVIGRIVDYEIVPVQVGRKQLKLESERCTEESWASSRCKLLLEQKFFFSEYARFRVMVDEVLVGQPDNVLSVAWGHFTSSLPLKMKEGPCLIGLRKPGPTNRPYLGDTSATIASSPEPNLLTVLQAPCAPPFIIEATSAKIEKIRKILELPE